MNFKSRPEGRLNCRARIGSSAWLRGSSQNSKTSKINIASNITSVQFTKWDETNVGYVINFEGGFVQMVVEKPETGAGATARYYWNER